MLSRGARHFALFRGAVRGHGWGPTQGEGFLCMPVALVSPPSATCLYVCTHGRHAFVWFALVNRDRVWLSACCNDYSVLTQFWMSLFYCRGRSCIRALPRGHDFLRTPALAPSAGGSRCQRRPPDPQSCPPPMLHHSCSGVPYQTCRSVSPCFRACIALECLMQGWCSMYIRSMLCWHPYFRAPLRTSIV